jgi:hypothetical protein
MCNGCSWRTDCRVYTWTPPAGTFHAWQGSQQQTTRMHKHKTTEVRVCMCGGTKDTDNETLVVGVDPMMQQTEDCGKCYVKVHSFVFGAVTCDQSSVTLQFKILILFWGIRNYRYVYLCNLYLSLLFVCNLLLWLSIIIQNRHHVWNATGKRSTFRAGQSFILILKIHNPSVSNFEIRTVTSSITNILLYFPQITLLTI